MNELALKVISIILGIPLSALINTLLWVSTDVRES